MSQGPRPSPAPRLLLALALCAAPLAAQGAPPTEPPPEAPVTVKLSSAGAGSPAALGAPERLSLREATALPPLSVLEADASPADAPIIREMVLDEALHRDRVARIRRLRQLAAQDGTTERLATLDRLESAERQRHETRALLARTRLSEPGFRATRGFMEQGGVLRLRRARASRADLRPVQQRPDGRTDARMIAPTRAGSLGSGTPQAGARNGTGRAGARLGGRGPR